MLNVTSSVLNVKRYIVFTGILQTPHQYFKHPIDREVLSQMSEDNHNVFLCLLFHQRMCFKTMLL